MPEPWLDHSSHTSPPRHEAQRWVASGLGLLRQIWARGCNGTISEHQTSPLRVGRYGERGGGHSTALPCHSAHGGPFLLHLWGLEMVAQRRCSKMEMKN